MNTFGLQKALQSQLIQKRTDELGGFEHQRPRQPFGRVQIESHPVRFFDASGCRVPGVEFHDIHLRGADQGFERVDFQQRRMLRIDCRVQRWEHASKDLESQVFLVAQGAFDLARPGTA